MKLIGLLGGLGWEVTATYYRMMHEYAARELGGRHMPRTLMHSIDRGAASLDTSDASALDGILIEAARSLKSGGADFMVMTANRMHHVGDLVCEAAGIDVLHIADPTGAEMKRDGCARVTLLGTSLAMESGFFADRLSRNYGISVMRPEPEERIEVSRIIAEELSQGIVSSDSRCYVGTLITQLHKRGAEAVILACPEIAMIVPPDCDVMPAYDAVRLHVRAAVRRATEESYV